MSQSSRIYLEFRNTVEIHYTDETTGLFTYRDFVGPEHKKIQKNTNIADLLIPWHNRLDQVNLPVG